MGMADRFYNLGQDIQMVTFSDIGATKKRELLEQLTEKADKLSKKFSKEERILSKLNIGENHMSNIYACQDYCYNLLQQLENHIQKEEEEGLI